MPQKKNHCEMWKVLMIYIHVMYSELSRALYFSLFHGKSFDIKKNQVPYYLRNLYMA